MNLDLLIKLAKLANNNPNEHEANSAARRACKLIAEGDYKFIVSPTKTNPAQTYNDIRRSTEPAWSGRPPTSAGNPFKQYYGGFDWGKASEDYHTYTPPSNEKKPKTKRVCTECGAEKETANTDLYFICANCQWIKYGGEKPSNTP